jgi:hypothetical protein
MPGYVLPPNIPVRREFTICPDGHGHWLAVEAHGLLGGVFINCKAAKSFALYEADGDAERVHIVTVEDFCQH